MGFNTTLVISNDLLGDIEKDEHFGKRVATAVSRLALGGPVEFRGGTAVETHHADGYVAVVIGNCTGEILGYAGNWHQGYHDKTEEQKKTDWLRSVAESMGYRIVKKPVRKR